MTFPLVLPLGESALTIRLAERASVENAERAAALAERIRRAGIEGVTDVVSAVASVCVYFDGDKGQGAGARATLESIAQSPHPPITQSVVTHSVPTLYNGMDLDEVAERVGLSRDEVIRRHAGREYHVLALGFLPGWAYLGSIDPALSLPRRATPRTRIPAGSVAIMGEQTGVYPRMSPGGWHVIGTTDVVMFDANRAQPALFRPGDRVRFVDAGARA